MLTSKPQKIAKVVICGMKGVGKTAILEQLIYGSVTPDTVSLNWQLLHTRKNWPRQIHHHFLFC